VKAALLTLMLTLSAAPAWDQDGEPVLVEALVVNAPTPGPAWWSVGKGNAKVWVLGVGVAVPASATWDDKVFKRRVRATGRVIAIRSSRTNFTRESVRTDRDWLAELSEPERARLVEIAAASGQKVEVYRNYRPNFAGILIKTDLENRAKPAPGPLQDLQSKARRLGAKLVLVSGDEAQALKTGFAAGGSDNLNCVRWAIRPRDAVAQREQRARAWMNGDVRTLMIGPAAYDPCMLAMKTLQDTLESGETAMADAIAGSLDRNERAVALVGLTPLLRQGGVLDQLRQRGYVIETPAQLDD
jgi:uncharacterized protein YbaP (TraB family)